MLESKGVIPDHQFGFRGGHSTVEQAHKFTGVIVRCLEEKSYCLAAFLDVEQTFYKV